MIFRQFQKMQAGKDCGEGALSGRSDLEEQQTLMSGVSSDINDWNLRYAPLLEQCLTLQERQKGIVRNEACHDP